MGRPPKILTADLPEHPAVRAWVEASGGARPPESLVVLKRKRTGAV